MTRIRRTRGSTEKIEDDQQQLEAEPFFLMGDIVDVHRAAKRLVEVTHEAMWRGIRTVRPGSTLGDIGHAIQSFAEAQRFSVVREYCGHGIGQIYHEDPQVLHYGKPGAGPTLREGMTFTIEPMINAGKRHVKPPLEDGWTVVTKDHSLSAQWEHTVLVTATGFEVLTLGSAERHGDAARVA